MSTEKINKTKILFYLVIILVIVSAILTYKKSFIDENYDFVIEEEPVEEEM